MMIWSHVAVAASHSVALKNNVEMPRIGLGMCCRASAGGAAATEAVQAWLEMGGSLIDTAFLYQNHREIGEGILRARASGVSSRDVFITTKLPPALMSYERTAAAIPRALEELGRDVLDLVLLHMPGAQYTDEGLECVRVVEAGRMQLDWRKCRRESWRALEQAYRRGQVRSIGVSNFSPVQIDDLLATADVPPMVNQIEFHPFFQNEDIVRYCKKRGIAVTAYGSFGGEEGARRIMQDPEIAAMAASYNATPSQVLLRFAIDQNISVVPGTSTPEHMVENLRAEAFSLNPEHLAKLRAYGHSPQHIYGNDPAVVI
jgi:diketogulonate reductase-like aldo/keto reductase